MSGMDGSSTAGRVSAWVLRALHDGAWVVDDAGVTTWANQTFADLVGVPPDELPGTPATDLCDATSRPALAGYLAGLAGGAPVADAPAAGDPGTADPEEEVEVTLVVRRGDPVLAVLRHAPLLDDDGVRRGWLLRVNLPSRRRLLYRQLRQREEQLAEAQLIGRFGSWEWGLGDEVVQCSELEHVYGRLPADFVPTPDAFFGLIREEDRDAAVADFRRMSRSAGEAIEFDARIVAKVGEPERWIRVRGLPVFDASGGLTGLRGTVQDVTESKEQERGLLFLGAMARTANEARTLQDALLASAEHVRPYARWPVLVVGSPSRLGREDLDFVDAAWYPVSEEERDAAQRVGAQAARERRIVEGIGPRGTTLVAGPVLVGALVACVVVCDSQRAGAPGRADRALFEQSLTLLAHVAERASTARQLARARDEALAASRAKSDFLATMSHEIRTPLNGVIGLSELLGRTRLDPHQRRLARGVDQAGRTLLALVNDVLDLSKIEAGHLDLEEVDFDPRTIVEQSAALVADTAAEKGLELVVSCAADLPALVRGDPVRFGQVITNLAANAVKFTAQGEVHIRAAGAGSRTGRGSRATVRVEVRDTGVGVAPEVQEHIFKPFSQADSSTTREYGGTGLGLAISRRIVLAMGGEIGLESAPGSGATFWFTAAFGVPEVEPSAPSDQTDPLAGLRVLVVDDNATNRFILSEQLEAWGVEVLAVDSAYDALVELDAAVAREASYQVVLLDYMMPGADGEHLARLVRSEERHAQLRLVLLTSAMQPEEEWLADAGIDDYLGKPVLPSRLRDMLAAQSGRQSPASDAAGTGGDTGQEAARDRDGGQDRDGEWDEWGDPGEPAETGGGRVLVVEDNQVNQLVAEGVLRRLGYDVVLAEHGAAGVAAVAEDPRGFDLVLMDCQMPVMDGYDATRAIRAMPGPASRIPIVAMTAAAVAEERDRCLEAGMDGFLAKPVDLALLSAMLTKWVAGPGRGAAARVAELLREGLDPEMVRRMAGRFSGDAASIAVRMRDARDAGPDQVARVAHGLRGSAANLGLDDLAARCAQVEEAARAGRLPREDDLDELAAVAAAAADDLARTLADLPEPVQTTPPVVAS